MAAEERLGARLRSAYRNFLLASNGFGYVGHVDLLHVDEIGWFAERAPGLVETWNELDDSYREMFERSFAALLLQAARRLDAG
ncbi:hypothetical protein GCM10009754_63850 [Amycolatopsis minnesotensis]|uniref:Uncharacterized protein n=1 Tax=Amycolatopsis minnesotensis TaxID=337894 RepID=A0ABN2S254_9PSEU